MNEIVSFDFNAKKAREVTDKVVEMAFEEIYIKLKKDILKAIQQGEFECRFNNNGWHQGVRLDNISQELINKLRGEGFKVEEVDNKPKPNVGIIFAGDDKYIRISWIDEQ